MTQPTSSSPTPSQLQSQISSLTCLLTSLHQTRASLPSLLRSFSTTAASTTPLDRATVYRTSSRHASNCIKSLGEELERVEGVLLGAEESERRDPRGIRVREREFKTESEDGSNKVQEVLGGAGGRVQQEGKGRLKGEGAFHSTMGAVATVEQLRSLVQRWETEYSGRVKLELLATEGRDPHQLKLVLKGVMRAVLSLEWEGTCMVERVACFGLKEEKSPYLPSQYSLFNGITAATMEVIERGLIRRERQEERGEEEEGSNLEEVLHFLSDPPLPF